MMTTKTRTTDEPTAPTTRALNLRERAVSLNEAEQRLWQRAAELRARVESLTEHVAKARGEALLHTELGEGADAEGVAAQEAELATIEREYQGAREGIEAARRERRELIPGIWKAEADIVRARAAGIVAQAEAIEAQMQPHIDALAELSGCSWVPAGRLVDTGVGVQNLDGLPVPAHYQLRAQAKTIERDAENVARRGDRADSGSARAESIDELISAVLGDPLRVAPPAAEIIAWATAARDELIRFREQREPGERGAPMVFQLSWRGDEILRTSNCHTQHPSLSDQVSMSGSTRIRRDAGVPRYD